MNEQITISALYDLNETIAADIFKDCTYPWEVLAKIGDFIKELGKTLPEDEYEQRAEDVWVAKSATVYPTAYINGPCIIGKEAEVRHCAFIRGKAIVGEGAVVGNSTELKNVILFNKVQVFTITMYDSILGDIRHTWAPVRLHPMSSPIKADYNKGTGYANRYRNQKNRCIFRRWCRSRLWKVLNPGTIVGRNSNIYPLSRVRGFVPAWEAFIRIRRNCRKNHNRPISSNYRDCIVS